MERKKLVSTDDHDHFKLVQETKTVEGSFHGNDKGFALFVTILICLIFTLIRTTRSLPLPVTMLRLKSFGPKPVRFRTAALKVKLSAR